MYARRLLPNETYNVRDLGGYPTADGNVTRFGRFIRADMPEKLSEAGIRFLSGYGVNLVIDLRMEFEAEERPSPFRRIPGVRYLLAPFAHDFDILGAPEFDPYYDYIRVLERPNRLTAVMEELARSQGCALFHCSAGKDRTGMVAALLLLLAGTPEPDVAADYEITFTYLKGKYHDDIDILPNSYRSDARFLDPLFARVRESGGAGEFLLRRGVSAGALQALKARLLE
ncbi:MAG: tyrosine-protein phosphatase [Clostridiales bacterium]|jgi:protein-tyrosine phosphatase|nr:tyrosine-protein phosphatase [Clostridiales bacterium]